MHVQLFLRARTEAILSFHPLCGRYRLAVRILGERPCTGGVEPDLLLFPEGGGQLTLRPVIPLVALPNGKEWTASYGVEPSQLMLLAIYPMVRICLEPWTGTTGVDLDEEVVRNALRVAARRMMGLHPDRSDRGDLRGC